MSELTAGELALFLELPIRGDSARHIDGAAALDDATPRQLAFVGATKLFDTALQSRAGCLIALQEYPGAPGQTIIDSTQPRAHFAKALAILYPAAPLQPGIH